MTPEEAVDYDMFASGRRALVQRGQRISRALHDLQGKDSVRTAEAVAMAPAMWVGGMAFFAGSIAKQLAKPLVERVGNSVKTSHSRMSEVASGLARGFGAGEWVEPQAPPVPALLDVKAENTSYTVKPAVHVPQTTEADVWQQQ